MFDLHNNIANRPALNPQAITTNTTVNGAIIDLAGFNSAEFLVQSATLTDGTFTPSITEGNAANLSDGTVTAAADLLGLIASATFVATEDNAVKKLGYAGTKRYIRLNVTTTGVTSGGTIAAQVVLGNPQHAPV